MIGVESVVPSLAKTFSLLADPAYANTSAGVIQEIRNAVGGRFPSLVTLQRSPQAIGIYMETVRLFPTFFVAKAIATKDVTLTEVENSARTNSTDYQERKNVIGANTLSKGSEIFFLLFAVQRHASVRGSGNPEAIEPQRWIQPPASHPFLNTFSSTENANPLISLTMLSAHLTLVMLLDRYDFFPPDASEHPTTNCLRVKAKTL